MALLIRGAKQLLTLRGPAEARRGAALGELGVIPDGALLIRDGVIVEVGPSRRVENLAAARGAVEIDVTGKVVMPGFVDSHTHLIGGTPQLKEYEDRIAGVPGAGSGEGAGGGVPSLRATTARRLAARARPLAESMLRHGTTACEVKSGLGVDATGEFKVLRALSLLKGNPLDLEPTFGAIPSYARAGVDAGQLALRLLPVIRRRGLARFVDVSSAGMPENEATVLEVLETAGAAGFLLKIHAEELRHSGILPLALGFGAASVDHLEYANEEDARALAASPAIATVMPATSFHARKGRYAPARLLVDAGAALALASGFDPAASPTLNMQTVVSLACSEMRLTPAEAITAATINGAHALRRAGETGSLAVGKSADVIVLDVSDYREIPYYFGVNNVSMVIRRGVVAHSEKA